MHLHCEEKKLSNTVFRRFSVFPEWYVHSQNLSGVVRDSEAVRCLCFSGDDQQSHSLVIRITREFEN